MLKKLSEKVLQMRCQLRERIKNLKMGFEYFKGKRFNAKNQKHAEILKSIINNLNDLKSVNAWSSTTRGILLEIKITINNIDMPMTLIEDTYIQFTVQKNGLTKMRWYRSMSVRLYARHPSWHHVKEDKTVVIKTEELISHLSSFLRFSSYYEIYPLALAKQNSLIYNVFKIL